MIKSYKIIELLNSINWANFYEAFGYDAKFASIAEVQGCDVVRANWLTEFAQEDRSEASKAMQLLKEAYRILPQLDRDYKVFVEIPSKQEPLKDINPNISNALLATASAEIDLLYDNDSDKKRLTQILTNSLIDAAIKLATEEYDLHPKEVVDLLLLDSTTLNRVGEIFNLSSLEIEVINNNITPSYAKLVLLTA